MFYATCHRSPTCTVPSGILETERWVSFSYSRSMGAMLPPPGIYPLNVYLIGQAKVQSRVYISLLGLEIKVWFVWWYVRAKDLTDGFIDRQTERQSDKKTDSEIDRRLDRHMVRLTDGWMDRRTDGQIDRWKDEKMKTWTHRQIDRWMDGRVDR